MKKKTLTVKAITAIPGEPRFTDEETYNVSGDNEDAVIQYYQDIGIDEEDPAWEFTRYHLFSQNGKRLGSWTPEEVQNMIDER